MRGEVYHLRIELALRHYQLRKCHRITYYYASADALLRSRRGLGECLCAQYLVGRVVLTVFHGSLI